MRRILIAAVSTALLSVCVAAQTPQPSLGDFARQQRQAKKAAPTKVYTNEDFSASKQPIADAPAPDATSSSATTTGATADEKTASAAKAAPAKDSGAAAADPAKAAAFVDKAYRASVQKERAEIARLEKEIAEADRKTKIQSTNYYTDAGSRLRDPKAWTDQRAKMDKEMADNQQKLQEARTRLDDLLEQARKLGIPASSLD
jgi:hypothetical protein